MPTPNPPIPDVVPTLPELQVPLSASPAPLLVLLPVRLETRFFPLGGDGVELRVRVYPDSVHIDSHEPRLTNEEIVWGKHFWEQTWRAGGDQERARSAWQQLAERYDPPRAAWIAKALTPRNPKTDRPQEPVPQTEPLPKPIRFPPAAAKAASWTRAPETRTLPDHWTMAGYKNGALVVHVTGGLIPERLATGPDPQAPAVDDEHSFDAGMQWMLDFEEAERQGMGLRVRLTLQEAQAGLDFLLVAGVKAAPSAGSTAAQQLADLLDAHHYTGGLAFVAPGTPTNNTQDGRSGFRSEDPGQRQSYDAEFLPAATVPGTNAGILSAALGLPETVFANLPAAADRDALDARHMNAALWPATWGYFLLQMLGVGRRNENPLNDEDIAWARRHFVDFVRAQGPLPALRIGRQPYGILPVTSLSAWKPPAGREAEFQRDGKLRDVLDRLRRIWRTNAAETPRVGRSSDLDRDLAEVLSMDGVSSSYGVRQVIGRHYLQHLWVFLAAEFFSTHPVPGTTPAARAGNVSRMLRAWFDRQEQVAGVLLQQIGLAQRPRLSHATFAPLVAPLVGGLVQAGAQPTLTPDYIRALLEARDLGAIERHEVVKPLPPALLYLLLRHSMLLEYAAAGSQVLIKRGVPQRPEERREPELVGFSDQEPSPTAKDLLNTMIPVDGAGQMPLHRYLLGFRADGEPDMNLDPELGSLVEFRSALRHLQTLPPTRLAQLMAGTLDLASHRLDAWITSLAAKRLAELRSSRPDSMLLGGYGWVMNLAPHLPPALAPTPTGEPEPVFSSPENSGFVHTPSLAQATTAAVLRSAHLAHGAKETSADLLAVDLSSARVRLASWLLDGVRQGQPLGALLGYRFERGLQEVGKAQFIAPFRELAPLVARKRSEPDAPVGGKANEPVEAVAANNVADGLVLLQRWQQGQRTGQWNTETIPFGQQVGEQPPALPRLDPRNPDFAAVGAELDALANAVDAVSDALLAESVHQAVRGNPLRAAATVDAIAGGDAPPPELEVVSTPRSGVALTHRLVALFSGEPLLPPEWAAPPIPFRAAAEPHLNAWVARLLGSPAKVRCLVERLDVADGQAVETKDVRLNELRLAPLDLVYAVEGGASGELAEIEQRILYQIRRRKQDGYAPGALLRINPGRSADFRTDELSYGEFRELLRAVRRLLIGVRGLDADDVSPPEQAVAFGVDMDELGRRVEEAVRALRQTEKDLRGQIAQPETANLETLRNLMLRGACFGAAGAVPLAAAGDTAAERQALLAQAQSIQKELAQRLQRLGAGTPSAPPSTPAGGQADQTPAESQRDAAVQTLRIIFGKAFVVLPRFTPPNAAELQKALANNLKLQGGDPLAAVTWLQRVARVRDGAGRLNDALCYAEALGNPEELKLAVAQLPFAASDRWVGLPLKRGQTLPGGKLSLVVQAAQPFDVGQPLAGLLLDEWVEVVPAPVETTGIAFQYDRPNAAPPQAILLAVPPVVEAPWTVASLQQVLLETLDLARIRAVDPDSLDEVGQYLPAAYLAFNANGDTISTDFSTMR